MCKLQPKQALKLMKDVEMMLYTVPENMRTKKHSEYLKEVQDKIRDLKFITQ